MKDDIFIIIFEALIYGFCFTTLIIYVLGLFKSEKLKVKSKIFFNESISLVRIISLLYLIYLTYYFFRYYDYSLVENRATGPYAWAYWFMVFRPFIVILLVQLLWVKKLKNKSLTNFLLVLVLFIVLLFNGANSERFIIIITSMHRDYGASSFYQIDHFWYTMPLLIFAIFIERILIYTVLVLSSLFISKKYAEAKNI